MNNIVYVVHAYCWGDRDQHSYFVGAHTKARRALQNAKKENDYRGGEYVCEVLEVVVDSREEPKVILALPEIDVLTQMRGELKK